MSNNKSKVTAVTMAARLSSRCWDRAVHPCLGIRESPQTRSLVLVRESREEGMHANEQVRAANGRAAASTCRAGLALSSGDFHSASLWAKAGGLPAQVIIREGVARLGCGVFIPKGCLGVTQLSPGEALPPPSIPLTLRTLLPPTRAPHYRAATEPEVRHSQTRTIRQPQSHPFCQV